MQARPAAIFMMDILAEDQQLVQELAGHSNPTNPVGLFRLWNRARRCIALSPFGLLGEAANVFAPLKRQGATVVAAADEKQLNQQLDFVLEEKILLEKDDKK